ncbi:MAG: CopG family transcriptional regulator [Chloroflexi bacterium]|nr:CopG family transcriptional regulator [Chloroflexota bacterium]
MKASEFDKKFDTGENTIAELDLPRARRPGEEIKRINLDLPAWMLSSLDREARRLGVTRQSVIKMWLAERLGQEQ